MKTSALILFSLLCALPAGAQTVNVHLKDGSVVKYDSSEFDYIDFSAKKQPGEQFYLSCPDDHHPHMIDLGLPSGTLWACCNVGASAPEQYGNYYAWGETQPKSDYTWENYAYWQNLNGDGYQQSNEFQNIGSDIAGTGYDAATANWGAPWRMPSLAQCEELVRNTTYTWTSVNGVYGGKFTGPNGGTMFLPAAGRRWDGGLYYEGLGGLYRSSSLYEGDPRYGPRYAYHLYFKSGDAYWDYWGRRYDGQSVRPVR